MAKYFPIGVYENDGPDHVQSYSQRNEYMHH